MSLVLCLAAIGCSGDDGGGTPNPQAGAGGAAGAMSTAGNSGGGVGGAGGMAGTAAGSGGTGAAGAGGTSGMSMLQACLLYVRAACNRERECAGQPRMEHPCQERENKCPDLFFSEGSTRTVDGTVGCATAVTNADCKDIGPGRALPCALPGTRKGGDTCLFGSQCTSLYCVTPAGDTAHPECMTCSRIAASTDDCSQPGVACPVGSICGSGKCVDVTTIDAGTPVVPTLPGLGEACPELACRDDLRCLQDPVAGGNEKCAVLPAIGQPCGKERGADDLVPIGHVCAQDAYCNASHQCVAWPAIGQACGTGFGSVPLGQMNSMCDRKVSHCMAGSCLALGAQGISCDTSMPNVSGQCAEGLLCDRLQKCSPVVREGEACDATASVCADGTTCMAGKCESMGLQGLFTAACGM